MTIKEWEFTGLINLGHFDDRDREEINADLQNAIYDVLDDHGVQYRVLQAEIVEVGDPSANGMGPFASGSETSRAAAISNYPRSGSQRHRVLLTIARGQHGATADEIAEEMGVGLNSVRPRIVELREGGWIKDTRMTRKTPTGADATVMVLTTKGQRYVNDKEYVS
jgi:hypothetical protein